MTHDAIPEDEAPPLVIQTGEQARIAAQCVLDYADWNLTRMEGADCPTEWAQQIYDAATALVAAFDTAPAPAAPSPAVPEKSNG